MLEDLDDYWVALQTPVMRGVGRDVHVSESPRFGLHACIREDPIAAAGSAPPDADERNVARLTCESPS